ncbi:hypothetical protein Pla163_03910 [Planctomycetes bacterium Pla163]|uniref:DUF1365 domain-containing protein n=1 Tax=Rohdeia mirabilis TaxID=2528008 RepID=A0A518CVN7_9BACT|nr:hypothetical protein Pla163_03910 [Planctomycetes bacterium Pla163]
MTATLASGLFEGRVSHRRLGPREHAFDYRVGFVYLDLDELDEVFARRWLWSLRGPNVVRFRRSDYLGDPAVSLREAVLDRVERALGRRPTGAVRMLTQLRTWGYVFNPVTFYYCFDPAGQLESVVAEITNTPWRERHAYVLDARGTDTPSAGPEAGPGRRHLRWTFDKDFHVSPFFGMEQSYEWSFSVPGDELDVRMTNREDGRVVFHVSLACQRRELTGLACAGFLVRHPLLTWRVHLAIYWQALRLYLKRTPFFVHPKKRATPGGPAADSR